jgi:hypothetical protein
MHPRRRDLGRRDAGGARELQRGLGDVDLLVGQFADRGECFQRLDQGAAGR